jgi:ABC-type multidrug transport system permease subunit
VQTVFFGIVLSLLWAGNGRSKELVDRASLSGLFFFIAINQAFIGVFSVIFDFPVERSVVTRERASSTYRTSSYYLSKMVTDLPRSMFYAVLFTVAVYFTVGLKLSIGSVLRFYLVTLGVSNFGEALAITISVVTGNAQTSAAIAPVLIIISVLFAGFFTQTGQIPGFVRWIKWISFVYFSANAFAQVEFPDRAFGAQILKDGGYNDLSYWVNMAGLLAIIVALRLIGYLALKFLRGPRFLSF